MASRERKQVKRRSRSRSSTPEGREQQITARAMELAEEQIENGTASAQVISHFLKAGSQRERLEQERLQSENALLKSRIKQIEDGTQMIALYEDAIQAMRGYSGQEELEEYHD